MCLQLDQRADGDAIQDALLEVTGRRSVPQVFIGGTLHAIGGSVREDLNAKFLMLRHIQSAGEFFGGGDETAAAAINGSLHKVLAVQELVA